MISIERVIQAAKAEIGYMEKRSNKDLYDKTANVGRSNYTKYAAEIDAMGNVYNGKKNGFPWCDVFVDWLFISTFGKDMGMKMLYQSEKSLGAGCRYSMNYYKAAGQFYTEPQIGDQIFFTTDGKNCAHTGIVVKLYGKTVFTIEGNTSMGSGVTVNGGEVCLKVYKLFDTSIIGYGRPNYALVEKELSVVVENKPWYADDAEWAKEMGLTHEADRPAEAATRAETWAMLHRLYKKLKGE